MLGALCICAAAAPLLAWAGGGKGEQVHLTMADVALARESVLSKAALPRSGEWVQTHSSSASPVSSSAQACLHARDRSGFVFTGHADRDYEYGRTKAAKNGQSVSSTVNVLPTRAMAEGDWKASAFSYKTVNCLFEQLAKASPHTRLVSVDRLRRLQVGNHTVAVRARLRLTTHGVHVPINLDLLGFTVGRCQETFLYSYVDIPLPSFARVISEADERTLATGLVEAAGNAGCLRADWAPKPGPVARMAACDPSTQIISTLSPIVPGTVNYETLTGAPSGTQVVLQFSPEPTPRFDQYQLYAGPRAFQHGAGYPRGVTVLLFGTAGTKEVFTLTRTYLDADGLEARTCASARVSIAITSGAVTTIPSQVPTPPPPPSTLPPCDEPAVATLTPSSGPSGTAATLQFTQPATPWAGFELEVFGGAGSENGGGFPSAPLRFVETGVTGQKIVYRLIRDDLSGNSVTATCVGAEVTFTIT